jgi:hypothetical protein
VTATESSSSISELLVLGVFPGYYILDALISRRLGLWYFSTLYFGARILQVWKHDNRPLYDSYLFICQFCLGIYGLIRQSTLSVYSTLESKVKLKSYGVQLYISLLYHTSRPIEP